MDTTTSEGVQGIMAKRVNFYLAELQIKELKAMSKKTGLSASEILRRAIDDFFERFEKKGRAK